MTEASTPTPKDTTPDAAKSSPQIQSPEQTSRPTQRPVPVAEPVKQEVVKEAMPPLDPDKTPHVARPESRPHAFVIMPFGKKKGGDGSIFDFNMIYNILIKPALDKAGFEPFRADEETTSGDILTDMFQELLLADLCLCDLSIDNANVFYELGIRHAFRKRGVVHIQAGRAYMPFDIFNVRTLPYHITPDGTPDPAFIKTDIQAIARMTRDTWASDRDTVHSPVFNLLTGLKEPDRKALRTPLATGFWREYNEWKEKVTVAQRQKRIGDILLLTEEIQNPLIKEEAIGEAGKALASMGRNELALTEYRKGLEVNPANLTFRHEEAFHLNRLGKVDEAIVKIENLLRDFPDDTEAVSYLGRIYKEMWTSSWKHIRDKAKRLKSAFDSYHWLIKSADIYLKGFHDDLNNYYPGINALTLSTIVIYLANKFDDKKDPDPDISRIRRDITEICSALTFGLEEKAEDDNADYWTLISLAELRVLTADNTSSVVRAYRKALTASRRNLFFLNSSLEQLEMLLALGLRSEFVQMGINTIRDEIARTSGDENLQSVTPKGSSNKAKKNGRSFLFAGYMVDYPTKDRKTFPVDKEKEIRQEIVNVLEKFNLNPNDRAFVGGLAAGSEILFAEICAEKGVKVRVYLPLPESAYVRQFVSPGGDTWINRFYEIRNHPLVQELYQLENVGMPKEGDDPFERNNRWALYSSLGRGLDKVHLIALWNPHGGDVPKDRDARLVYQMIELMREMGGPIEQISTSKYVNRTIDNVFDRLMDKESHKSNSAPIARKSRRNKK
jgi:tetratricopeptide (TPR) repeat protein